MDPRTLAQAAERLAKYTSADPQGPLPEQQWTDLYNEGGSLDMGEGAEGTAACDVVLARVRETGSQQQAQQQQAQQQQGQQQHGQQGQQHTQQQGSQQQQQQGQQQQQQGAEEWRCSFGPHKVGGVWFKIFWFCGSIIDLRVQLLKACVCCKVGDK